MRPTESSGLCGICRDPNPYTQTNCLRCGARSAWAFLIDGKKDTDFCPPLIKFFARLFGIWSTSSKRLVFCRFCKRSVLYDERSVHIARNGWQAHHRLGRAAAPLWIRMHQRFNAF